MTIENCHIKTLLAYTETKSKDDGLKIKSKMEHASYLVKQYPFIRYTSQNAEIYI